MDGGTHRAGALPPLVGAVRPRHPRDPRRADGALIAPTVLLWLTDEADDLDPLPAPSPDLVVRLTLTGAWPPDLHGVPVRALYDVVPPSVTEEAYHDATRYVADATSLPGADGRPLVEVRWMDDLRLWSQVDLFVHDLLWMWMRLVRAVDALLEALSPRRVVVWGADARRPWVRETVIETLRARGVQVEAPPPLPRLPLDLARDWARVGAARLGGWYPALGLDADSDRGERASARLVGERLHLVTLADRFRFHVPAAVDVARARLSAWSTEPTAVGLCVDDGTARASLFVTRHAVTLGACTAPVDGETEHAYVLWLVGDCAAVYVDDALALLGPAEPSQGAGCAWGHFPGASDVESAWRWVEWGRRPLPHAPDARLEGLLSRLEAVGAALDAPPPGDPWRARGQRLFGAWRPPDALDVTHGQAATFRVVADEASVVTLSDTWSGRLAVPADCTVAAARARRFGGGAAVVGFALDTGRLRQRVCIEVDGVRLEGGPLHPHDVAVDAEYRLELDGERARLFVGEALVSTAPTLPGEAPGLTFGHFERGGDTESRWTWLQWGRPRTPNEERLEAALDALRETRAACAEQRRARLPARLPRAFTGPREPALAPLLRPAATAPAMPATRPPEAGGVLLLVQGGELDSRVDESGATVVDEPLTEGLADAVRRAGLPLARISLGGRTDRVSAAAVEAEGILPLSDFDDGGTDGTLALDSACEAWRRWKAGEVRFPPYRGVSPDPYVDRCVEAVLPHMAPKIAERRRFERALAHLRPTWVVSSQLATSHRHLVDTARRAGARTLSPVIGAGRREHLLYWLCGDAAPELQPDLCTLWGRRQLDGLRAFAAPRSEVVARGRCRLDTFVRHRPAPGGLRELGLPDEVERVVVFADVLQSTLHTAILSEATCAQVLGGILAALGDRCEVHVVWKPWRGDDLGRVRRLAATLADRRLHVLDPDAPGYHNADLLAHAATTVSSPTSMLAEHAAMGARPILLRLPETLYYYGRSLHETFAGFCRVLDDPRDVTEAVKEALAPRPLDAGERDALTASFGLADGRSAERIVSLCSLP